MPSLGKYGTKTLANVEWEIDESLGDNSDRMLGGSRVMASTGNCVIMHRPRMNLYTSFDVLIYCVPGEMDDPVWTLPLEVSLTRYLIDQCAITLHRGNSCPRKVEIQ
jgi:hypothetical protein